MALEVAIVGAGVSGLAAAATLARDRPTALIERARTPGGVLGADAAIVRDLMAECAQGGVDLRLGVAALRWQEGRLLLADGGRLGWLTAERLLVASGRRPSTTAELGIQGSRPSGVLSAPSALALLRAGVRIAENPVILGAGHWAEAVALEFSRIGVRREPMALAGEGGELIPLALRGTPRVSELLVKDADGSRLLSCDAVVLAARPRPARTVAGAVLDGSPQAIFLQAAGARDSAEEVAVLAREAAEALAPRASARPTERPPA